MVIQFRVIRGAQMLSVNSDPEVFADRSAQQAVLDGELAA